MLKQIIIGSTIIIIGSLIVFYIYLKGPTNTIQSLPKLTESPIIGNNTIVNLSNKNLESFPKELTKSDTIEILDISNNNIIGALPSEIRNLKNLRILKANNNRMTGVPAEIGKLSKLEQLDLSNNNLTGLPNELGNLQNLKVLNLSGNSYSEQDLETIKKNLPKTTELILN